MRTIILSFLLLSFFYLPSAMADDKEDLIKFMRDKIGQVLVVLRDKTIDKPTRNQKILDIADPIFDYARMAKSSLGKKYWSAMNKQQKADFVETFVKKLKGSYLEKLDLYTDEDVLVEKAVDVKKRIYIYSYLVSKGDRKEMIYKFYKSKEGWRVYDVEILGVSMVQTYRSQFDGLLKKGTVDDLLTKLKTADDFTWSTDKAAPAPATEEEEEN